MAYLVYRLLGKLASVRRIHCDSLRQVKCIRSTWATIIFVQMQILGRGLLSFDVAIRKALTGFKVLPAVTTKSCIFWNITPASYGGMET
jgi:hypothetical protein